MRFWTLIENSTCREELHAEHGLSLYLEACGKRILFDAGQTTAFADNAEKLGIDLIPSFYIGYLAFFRNTIRLEGIVNSLQTSPVSRFSQGYFRTSV